MKYQICFVLFLFILSDATLAAIQEPPQLDRWRSRRIADKYAKRRPNIFNAPNTPIINTYKHQTFSEDEIIMLDALIPDFQVNENAGPNGAVQWFPSISIGGSGNFVMTWIDHRNGDSDIYAQRYSSDGIILGKNFKVNDDDTQQIPTAFVLYQNYPNPFNPSTKITYSIPKSGLVTLTIYDRLGKKIQTLVNVFQTAGTYAFHFDTSGLSSGVYFYRIQVGSKFVETKKMVFMQ